MSASTGGPAWRASSSRRSRLVVCMRGLSRITTGLILFRSQSSAGRPMCPRWLPATTCNALFVRQACLQTPLFARQTR